ncbi:MAG: M15 family metallopeptidase [Gammaproteobacteria bacterium]
MSFFSRLLMLVVAGVASCAAEIPHNDYGLPVVRSVGIFKELVRRDPSKRLVDLRDMGSGVLIDIRYAKENNFMQRCVYTIARPLLREPAAMVLREVQRDLAEQGLGIKVLDAYRPYQVTQQMWGPATTAGRRSFLTLVELATGREFEMPTAYYDFPSRAHHGFLQLEEQVMRHRGPLREVMERQGFERFSPEGRHYDLGRWVRFESMSLPLEEVP